MNFACMHSMFLSNYLMNSERSSIEEFGFGFFMLLGTLASYFLLTTVFPPNFTNASTCSSVHSSSFRDRTCGYVKSFLEFYRYIIFYEKK